VIKYQPMPGALIISSDRVRQTLRPDAIKVFLDSDSHPLVPFSCCCGPARTLLAPQGGACPPNAVRSCNPGDRAVSPVADELRGLCQHTAGGLPVLRLPSAATPHNGDENCLIIEPITVRGS
jgi:hypothetical protein